MTRNFAAKKVFKLLSISKILRWTFCESITAFLTKNLSGLIVTEIFQWSFFARSLISNVFIRAGTSSIIQFNAAIGLGMLVAGLQQEKFSDIFGQDGYVLITKAKGALESAVYNEELQNRSDCLRVLIRVSLWNYIFK